MRSLSTNVVLTCARLSNITMHVLMPYKTALMTECLITYCTAVRAFTTMYALMFYQSALCTKCLITYCTVIRLITTMYALMCYQMALLT